MSQAGVSGSGGNTSLTSMEAGAALDSAQTALSTYENSQQPECLEEATQRAQALVQSLDLENTTIRFRADALHLGARTLLARFARYGNEADLAAARLWLGNAEMLVGAETADAGSYLDTLASGLGERFQQTGDPTMLREALSLAEKAAALTPAGHPNRPGHLNNLASKSSDWFRHSDDTRFLETAIAALKQALGLTPEGHPNRPIYLTNLANRYSERFWKLRDPADLEAGIVAAQEAVRRTDEGHPNRGIRLHNLANVLADRFDHFGKIADLNAAIQADDDALTLTPVGHPNEAAILNNLAMMYLEQFRRLGNLLSLEAALESSKEAVAVTPSAHHLKPAMLNTLANTLSERFRRHGNIADLEAAIGAAEQAVNLTPDGNIDRPGRLNNLANMKFERFKRWDDLADLEAAIRANQEAIKRDPHPERASFLNTRSAMLSRRFKRLGEENDLDGAVAAATDAALLAKQNSQDRPMYFNTLANGLLERFHRRGVVSDLEEAIRAAREALDLIPEGNPDRHVYLNNLAMGLNQRFDRFKQETDLEAAIDAVREAIALTSDDNPALPMYLNNLADVLQSRHSRSGELADLEAAIAAHKQAIARLHAMVTIEPHLSQLARQASEHTRKLVGLLWTAQHFAELAPAIENGRGVRLRADMVRADKAPHGLDAAEAARYQYLVRQQLQLRAEAEGLRAAIADTWASTERLLKAAERAVATEKAVEEESYAQSIFKEKHLRAELAEKRALLFKLHDERAALETRDPTFDPPLPGLGELRALADLTGDVIVYLQPLNESQGTVWQIITGVDRDSKPDTADQTIAENFTPTRLHALLANNPAVGKGKSAEPLGWLSLTTGGAAIQRDNDRPAVSPSVTTILQETMEHVLAVLGRELLAPLAKRLRDIGAKRVVLIPSGQLAFLPLHAAKIDGDITFGDLFEVRYTASATLLAAAYNRLPASLSVDPRLTAIANPDRSLPFADGQVRSVAKLFSKNAASVAFGTKAGKAWFFKHAIGADFIELSTHARFDLEQPVHSAFQLAHKADFYEKSPWSASAQDGNSEHDFEWLTLGEIWSGALVLKPGCVVVANACETGLIDLRPEALEEHLGFPTAFIGAGAATVIASFWSVNDFSTWLLMSNVYDRMITRKESASRALQQASQDLRSLTPTQIIACLDAERIGIEATRAEAELEKDDEAYIAAISTLDALRAARKRLAQIPSGDRPFAHPYYWAAFAVHGAVNFDA
jgi:CHAT domain-containing protein